MKFSTRKVSSIASYRKIFSQIPINTDWSQLTDRWVFPESRFHENILVCVTRSDQQRDDSTENDESAVPLRLIPPFLPFFFCVFKINTIDAPLFIIIRVAQMFENIRVVN